MAKVEIILSTVFWAALLGSVAWSIIRAAISTARRGVLS